MAKVITVSRTFLQGHPRAGQDTFFPEMILNAIMPKKENGIIELQDIPAELMPLLNDFALLGGQKKLHTIRAGKRWKTGDMCSLRVWSGKPYNSKQITIAPDFALPRVADIEITGGFDVYVDGELINGMIVNEMATNDGLTSQDLYEWFKKSLPFDGQILFFTDTPTPY